MKKKMKTHSIPYYISLFITLFFSFSSSYSQTVRVTLHQPPPNQLSVSSVWRMTLDNRTDSTLSIYLFGTAMEQTRSENIADATSANIMLPPGRTDYNYRSFETGTVNWYNDEYKTFILRTNTVPAGNYKTCVTVFSSGNSMPLSIETCISIPIIRAPVGEITLISPMNDDSLGSENTNFIWQGGSLLPGEYYRFRIVEIIGNQSPEAAIIDNPALFETGNLTMSSFQYPASAPKMQEGKKYAWRITKGEIVSESYKFNFKSSRSNYKTSFYVCWPFINGIKNFQGEISSCRMNFAIGCGNLGVPTSDLSVWDITPPTSINAFNACNFPPILRFYGAQANFNNTSAQAPNKLVPGRTYLFMSCDNPTREASCTFKFLGCPPEDSCFVDSLYIRTGFDYSTNKVPPTFSDPSWKVIMDNVNVTPEPRNLFSVVKPANFAQPLPNTNWLTLSGNATDYIAMIEYTFCLSDDYVYDENNPNINFLLNVRSKEEISTLVINNSSYPVVGLKGNHNAAVPFKISSDVNSSPDLQIYESDLVPGLNRIRFIIKQATRTSRSYINIGGGVYGVGLVKKRDCPCSSTATLPTCDYLLNPNYEFGIAGWEKGPGSKLPSGTQNTPYINPVGKSSTIYVPGTSNKYTQSLSGTISGVVSGNTYQIEADFKVGSWAGLGKGGVLPTSDVEVFLYSHSPQAWQSLGWTTVSSGTVWNHFVKSFNPEPGKNWSKLVFKGAFFNNSSGKAGAVEIKNVKICKADPCESAIAIFTMSDSICTGGPFILDASGSRNATNYFIGIEESDALGNRILGTEVNEWIGMHTPEELESYDFGDWYSGKGRSFQCGKYYRVGLAVQNNCTQWHLFNKIFYYDCNQVDSLCCETDSITINTGYDNYSHSILSVGQVDPDWKIINDNNATGPSTPYSPNILQTNSARPWRQPFNNTQWIGPTPIAKDQLNTYTLEYKFCLRRNFSNPVISFLYVVDGRIDVILNGNIISNNLVQSNYNGTPVGSFNFNDPTMFTDNGYNSLQIRIQQDPNTPIGISIEGAVMGNKLLKKNCPCQTY